MKTEVRLLPHLNQLYLQKKSYDIHRQKIQTIKRSNSFSKRSFSSSRILQNQQDLKQLYSPDFEQIKAKQAIIQNINEDIIPGTHMETIQQAKPGLLYWMRKMTPLQRRIKQQQLKQNKRMKQKIKKSASFITTKGQIQAHNQLCGGMKKRLLKFSSDQNSHKTALKCEFALKKISQLQKAKLKTQQSRIKLFEKSVKSTSEMNQSIFQQKSMSQVLQSKSKDSLFKNEKIKEISRTRTHQKSLTKIKSNIVMNNSNIGLQQKSKTALLSKYKDVKMPTIRTAPKFRNIKTQPSQFFPTNRNNNDSKLSQLSNSTLGPHKALSEYKILKVNHTQPSERGIRNIPAVKYEYNYNRQKLNIMRRQSDTNSLISKRIRTQGPHNYNRTQNISVKSSINRNSFDRNSINKNILNKNSSNKNILDRNNFNKNKPSNNRYDYQRKRIERFLTSKNSIIMKDIQSPLKTMNNIKTKLSLPLQMKKSAQQTILTKQTLHIEKNNKQIKSNTENKPKQSVIQEIQNIQENKNFIHQTQKQVQQEIIQEFCFATEIQ